MRSPFSALVGACFLGLLGQTSATAAPPDWWDEFDVTNSQTSNDFAAVNVGQAKWMVSKALRALQRHNPYWAGRVSSELKRVTDLTIPATKSPEWLAKQKAPLRLGQLKALSKPFYKVLHAECPQWLDHESVNPAERGQLQINGTKDQTDGSNYLPWSSSALDDKNTAIANLGQLKAVFSLRFEDIPNPFADDDGDNVDDAWTALNGTTGGADPDGDGMIGWVEYLLGFNPNSTGTQGTAELAADRDGDGMPDSYEIKFVLAMGTWLLEDPLGLNIERRLDWDLNDSGEDPDQDNSTNLEEYLAGTDPFNPDGDLDDILDGDDSQPFTVNISQKIQALDDAVVNSVDPLLEGKDSSVSMPLYTGIGPNWKPIQIYPANPNPGPNPTPNSNSWLPKCVRDQIGVIMAASNNWDQSYGLIPITPRHCINCGHNGIDKDADVGFITTSGRLFTTKVMAWINDNEGVAESRVSGTKQIPSRGDYSIYLLQHPLPQTEGDEVKLAKIFPRLTPGETNMMKVLGTPQIAISQGNGATFTPNNRMAYIYDKQRLPFYHFKFSGDSGSPRYLLVGSELYLFGQVTADEDWRPHQYADQLDYINDMIDRADAFRVIDANNPKYTVTASPWPVQ